MAKSGETLETFSNISKCQISRACVCGPRHHQSWSTSDFGKLTELRYKLLRSVKKILHICVCKREGIEKIKSLVRGTHFN